MGRKDRVLEKTRIGVLSNKLFRLQKQGLYHTRPDRVLALKRSHRTSKAPLWRGFLQPVVCRTKIKRQLEAYNRSQKIERSNQDSYIQNGVSPNSLDPTHTRESHILNRSHRCILSRTHSSGLKKVSKDSVQRKGLPIQGVTFRAQHSPIHLHSGSVSGESSSPSERNATVPLLGRLVGPDKNLSRGSSSEQLLDQSMSRIGSDCQSPEVRANPFSKFHIHRGSLQPEDTKGNPKGGKCPQTQKEDHKVLKLEFRHCKGVSVNLGIDGVPIQVHPKLQALHEASAMALKDQLGSTHREPVSKDTHIATGQTVSHLVGAATREPSRSSSPTPNLSIPYVHRCVRTGLGGSCLRCSGHQVSGQMDTGGITSAHKQLRVESSQASSSELQSSSSLSNSGGIGQQDSSESHKQVRRHSLLVTNGGDSTSLPDSHPERVGNKSKVHPRTSKRHSRCPIKSRTDSAIRVEHSPKSSGSHISEMGSSTDRPVRDKNQHKVSSVCLTSTRQGSLGNRCPVPKLPRSRRIRLSSFTDTVKDATAIPNGSGLFSDCNSTMVAQTDMVPNIETISSRTSNSTSSMGETAKTATIRDLPSAAGSAKSSRLEAEERALMREGFEEEVANRIANPLAGSTNKVYDAKFNIWHTWATNHRVDPNNPTIPQISSFLNKLFNDGQSVSSITGYRAALASSLKFSTDLDITNSVQLSRLILYFTRMRPPRSTKMPKWDLDLVLWTLLDPPFEPVWDEEKCPIKFLTWKVAFLLLLATGARRGELHAINYDQVSFHESDTEEYATLRTNPDFVAKTSLQKGEPMPPFRIPSLKRLVGSASQDRKLCPVRALRAYLKRTPLEMRKGRKKLLITYVQKGIPTEREIASNTVSRWITDLIHFAYKQPGSKALSLSGRNAHEVRAYAATLVQKGCRNMEDVLAAGQWSGTLVFVDHYLRDMTEQQGNISKLGPIVAAQKVIQL